MQMYSVSVSSCHGADLAQPPTTDCKFAITIPCYKSESTIADTLRGIMAQEEEVLRRVSVVVIADDESPDRTVQVAKEVWQREWPPLKFEARRRNLGEMINVNTAVAGLPDGVEWFLHMHGDNIPKPGWLRIITDRCLHADRNIAIVCASYDVLHPDGHSEPGEDLPNEQPRFISGGRESVQGTIRRGCWWHNSCGAIRVSAFREVGGLPPDMRQKGDWDLLLRILAARWDIEYIPRTLMLYRMHKASASSFAFQVHLDVEESLQIIQKHARVLTSRDILRTHGQYSWALVRRFGASLYRREFRRSRRAFWMFFRTWLNCLGCMTAVEQAD